MKTAPGTRSQQRHYSDRIRRRIKVKPALSGKHYLLEFGNAKQFQGPRDCRHPVVPVGRIHAANQSRESDRLRSVGHHHPLQLGEDFVNTGSITGDQIADKFGAVGILPHFASRQDKLVGTKRPPMVRHRLPTIKARAAVVACFSRVRTEPRANGIKQAIGIESIRAGDTVGRADSGDMKRAVTARPEQALAGRLRRQPGSRLQRVHPNSQSPHRRPAVELGSVLRDKIVHGPAKRSKGVPVAHGAGMFVHSRH